MGQQNVITVEDREMFNKIDDSAFAFMSAVKLNYLYKTCTRLVLSTFHHVWGGGI